MRKAAWGHMHCRLANTQNKVIILDKQQGELGELRDHVRHCDQFRERKKLWEMMEKQSLEEDGI